MAQPPVGQYGTAAATSSVAFRRPGHGQYYLYGLSDVTATSNSLRGDVANYAVFIR
jgi:hypothetical protein